MAKDFTAGFEEALRWVAAPKLLVRASPGPPLVQDPLMTLEAFFLGPTLENNYNNNY
eukprot:SAG22_NODE_621_length_8504_cov_3.476859_4_plen_57_part_00